MKMSGPAQSQSSVPTTKVTTDDSSQTPQVASQKPSAQLEEDDEFEDFPVEGEHVLRREYSTICLIAFCLSDWGDEETDLAGGEASKHLWEESWDDDDTSEDFAQMLRYMGIPVSFISFLG